MKNSRPLYGAIAVKRDERGNSWCHPSSPSAWSVRPLSGGDNGPNRVRLSCSGCPGRFFAILASGPQGRNAGSQHHRFSGEAGILFDSVIGFMDDFFLNLTWTEWGVNMHLIGFLKIVGYSIHRLKSGVTEGFSGRQRVDLHEKFF
ncbi:hypothetical protein ACFQWB_16580 [Paenibacillus thermoaerophilus]|jgi:hypothetical protein|uniref:Uncharacterized protein n=1 Tax=Paenibacillus thermoaerophilus TaxID=1215385 RepID=A0ABW2V9X9_9BACL|nr:hypothetical protein [Paenibacillus thermoaerophilus]TMV07516.1 hypothetical protein FE781_15660 [Paenibacillus thermoaerophilus]